MAIQIIWIIKSALKPNNNIIICSNVPESIQITMNPCEIHNTLRRLIQGCLCKISKLRIWYHFCSFFLVRSRITRLIINGKGEKKMIEKQCIKATRNMNAQFTASRLITGQLNLWLIQSVWAVGFIGRKRNARKEKYKIKWKWSISYSQFSHMIIANDHIHNGL